MRAVRSAEFILPACVQRDAASVALATRHARIPAFRAGTLAMGSRG